LVQYCTSHSIIAGYYCAVHLKPPVQLENYQLAKIIEQNEMQIRQNHRIIRLLCLIAEEEEPPLLHKIQIQFKEGISMPTPGPVTLTTLGQQVIASVVGFDQFGQPFTGQMPAATFSSDDTSGAVVTFDPATGLTTAVANGVANISATLTTAEGLTLSDTESVTVAISGPPEPVLSSIKVAF
jgi:hypothetical protein